MTTIIDVFSTQVRNFSGKPAIYCGHKHLTYTQLDRYSSCLSERFSELGIRKGDVIALHLDRSIELVVAMLASLKVGAVYLPMDKSNSQLVNQWMIEKAQVRLVVTDIPDLYMDCPINFVIDKKDCLIESAISEDFPCTLIDRESPCYVMFTSGTSGKPKGVIVPHRAVVRLVVNSNYITISPQDNLLQLSPVQFDASTFEIWGALLNGASLVLYPKPQLDFNILKQEITDKKISILWLTAALFHVFAENLPEIFAPLRVLLAGGDVLSSTHVRNVLNLHKNLTLINGYGPTENTTFTACHVMTHANSPHKTVPIGKVISGTCIHVLNENLQAVDKGIPGELFVSGAGVANGYLEDQAIKAFFHDASIAQGLIYRTGDIVVENVRGELEFVGRKDSQVKVRGYRVSLRDIEKIIMDLDCVSEAFVKVKNYECGDQIIACAIKLSPAKTKTIKQLRVMLKELLPAYMTPNLIKIIQKFPLNANGKVNREQLFENIL